MANKPFEFFDVIYKYLGSTYDAGSWLTGFKYLSEILFPIFLKQFLTWAADKTAPSRTGYLWAMGLTLVVFFKALTGLWGYYYLEICTLIIKNVVRGKIMKNISSIPPGAKKYVDVSKVTNYMMVDLGKVTSYTLFKPNIVWTPLVLAGLYVILAIEIGWVSLLIIVIIFIGFWI